MWFFAKDGAQQGPVEQEELLKRLASGELSAETLVWREGLADWMPLGKCEELKTAPPATPAAPVAPEEPAEVMSPGLDEFAPKKPESQAPQQPVPGGALVAPIQQNTFALTSLILGICGFLTCITGLVAIPFGHIALKQIKNSPTPQSGEGMAKAGLVMGYLCLLGVIAYIGFIIVAIVMGIRSGGATMP